MTSTPITDEHNQPIDESTTSSGAPALPHPSATASTATRRSAPPTWCRTNGISACSPLPIPIPQKLPQILLQFPVRILVQVHHVAGFVVGHGDVAGQALVQAEVVDGVLGGEIRSGHVVIE